MADNKLYEILGVSKNASDSDIKRVRRLLFLFTFAWLLYPWEIPRMSCHLLGTRGEEGKPLCPRDKVAL